ncbi:flagellar hook-associated protein FlgK [Pelagivirga sediminicola]|uniref:Flagellar hook-associated protein 1 n=1 Tax=Pelagivirga sediminicola TaxID=2170575 RepID=A0A2T7G8D5_9RHOB|nr:flagellar hook-associated protein FlgK [Pelagivirga sediminicola]PVA10667.1 flagellar hook-associated protein FlgK [Pelagivirga sediminicola]
MTLTSALSNALSGLTANARAASVVSSNLANIHTDGYGRRDLALTQDGYGTGGGVRVDGVTRHVDAGVLSDRREADSALSHSETRARFLGAVRDSVGTPDQPGSLSARIAALDAALTSAASRPDEAGRLQAVSLRAGELAAGFNAAAATIQDQRMAAEAEIASAVRSLNVDLAQVQDLNVQIQAARRSGGDSSGLLDHRQVVIDRIAELVPVREVPRDGGAVALMTPRGALLLDGPAVTLDFTQSNVIEPHMTMEGGMLSGIRINDRDVAPGGPRSPLEGGRLSALFDIRDTLATDAQSQLDAVARDVIERLQDPSVDPSRTGGEAGLFTDGGGVFAAADEIGIAGRMALNEKVDTQAGNELWRVRDGLGASAPGATGNAALLGAMSDALSARRVPVSGDISIGSSTAAQRIGGLVSHLAQSAMAEDRTSSYAAVRQTELQTRLHSDGVSSDAETQRLLIIEQAYGANARMIRTLDEMMQTLLRI